MKEQLLQELKQYKEILNIETMEYLKSLIELEISILNDENISYDSMNLLMKFPLYQQVSHYNIYKRALNLFQEKKKNYPIIIEENYNQLLIKYILEEEKIVPIFLYHYLNNYSKINLYEFELSKERREKEIKQIQEKIEILTNQKNPYYSDIPRTDGSSASIWLLERKAELHYLIEYLLELQNRTTLTEENNYKQAIHDYFTNLFIKDNKIDKANLKEVDSTSYLTKKLVKQYPNITLIDHITYY